MYKVTKISFLAIFILSMIFILSGCPEEEESTPTPTPIPPDPIEIDFESDEAGTTTYSAMGWTGVVADVGSVVTIASVTDLPANGASVNVLLVEPTDWNEICIFTITIPEGHTLGDYSTVSVDAYFPRNTIVSSPPDDDNYYKDFMLHAGVTLSGGAQTTGTCMDYFGTVWDEVDVWKTFTFDVDSASTLEGDIQIGVGISRPAISDNDGYYLDNIILE
jgi:hypothetical protein